jgi:hypothetical protein
MWLLDGSSPVECTPIDSMRFLPSILHWVLKHRLLASIALTVSLVLFAATPNGYRPPPRVKVAQATKTCREIAGAIGSYYADYKHLPIPDAVGAGSGDTDIADTSEAGDLLGVLASTKTDVTMNPRHHNYLDGMQQAKHTDKGMVNGVDYESDPERPTLHDPWGRGYRIRFDSDFDGIIANPAANSSGDGGGIAPTNILGKKCIVWNAGPDGNYDTWTDNSKSW